MEYIEKETESEFEHAVAQGSNASAFRGASITELDLLSYHERNAGRLVVDPEYIFPPFYALPA